VHSLSRPGSSGRDANCPAGHLARVNATHSACPGAAAWWLGSPMHILHTFSSTYVPRSPPAEQSDECDQGIVCGGEHKDGGYGECKCGRHGSWGGGCGCLWVGVEPDKNKDRGRSKRSNQPMRGTAAETYPTCRQRARTCTAQRTYRPLSVCIVSPARGAAEATRGCSKGARCV